jgi:hypothetical protein
MAVGNVVGKQVAGDCVVGNQNGGHFQSTVGDETITGLSMTNSGSGDFVLVGNQFHSGAGAGNATGLSVMISGDDGVGEVVAVEVSSSSGARNCQENQTPLPFPLAGVSKLTDSYEP